MKRYFFSLIPLNNLFIYLSTVNCSRIPRDPVSDCCMDLWNLRTLVDQRDVTTASYVERWLYNMDEKLIFPSLFLSFGKLLYWTMEMIGRTFTYRNFPATGRDVTPS